ncbi:hypothetical protein [Motilimonas sp. KMU-193]|uniref:hypothetical protein n=1 Tax=Motilimonas sp. KMU-193 TaxID=3388668 RepID=UPI00396B0744
MSKLKQFQAGIGLIEILIALLVVSVGVSGIVSLQKHMRVKSAEAEEHLVALRVGQETFDDLRSFGIGSFSSVSSATATSLNYLPQSTSASFTTFQRQVVPSVITSSPNQGITAVNKLYELKVNVNWTGLHGDSESIELKSAISPVSAFTSDNLYVQNNPGSGTENPLDDSVNPLSPSFVPPAYEPYDSSAPAKNNFYAKGDLVKHDGVTYKCKAGSKCRDHANHGLGNTDIADPSWIADAWEVCTPGSCL